VTAERAAPGKLLTVARLAESTWIRQSRGVVASELSSLCERLAGEVANELRSGRSKKWRCTADLRLRVVSHARVSRERGEPLGDIARRLGLVESTLARCPRSGRLFTRCFRAVGDPSSLAGR
jgi:hypothetical protein